MKNIIWVIIIAIVFICLYLFLPDGTDEYNRHIMEDVYGHKGNGWACDINGIDINLNK